MPYNITVLNLTDMKSLPKTEASSESFFADVVIGLEGSVLAAQLSMAVIIENSANSIASCNCRYFRKIKALALTRD